MLLLNERIKNAKDLSNIKAAIKKIQSGKLSNTKLIGLSSILREKFSFKNVAIFKVDVEKYPVLQIVFSEPMLNELKMSIMNNDYELKTINNNLILAVNDLLFDTFTTGEILAGMIHEIGHIINIDDYKDMFRRQLLTSDVVNTTQTKMEIDADSLAVYYGLSSDLMSFLTKIEKYSGIEVNYRKKNILHMLKVDARMNGR